MDVVGNMSSSIHTIHTILSNILTFKDDWFTLSDNYELQLEILTAMLFSYQEQFRLHQQPLDSPEMKILKKAEISLRKVESRLVGWQKFTGEDRCCSQMRLCSAKLIIALFPENIEQTVKQVEEDIKKIGTVFDERGKFIARMQEEQKRKAITKTVHNTDLYVPIEKPHSAIIKAINTPESHSVILLHGGVGRGKSTLAKSIYFSHGENSAQRFPIWVSCSNCSKDDIPSKQFEILQTYCPNILGDVQPTEKTGPNSRIGQALRGFLTLKKYLVILDDVADVEFLQGMWASTSGEGRDIKYLVTSQNANICGRMGKPKRVAMEKPTEDEAMKILASLVGIQTIPGKLQTIAEQIIEKVERNPLALACVASQFKFTENTTLKRVWKEVYNGLDRILSDKMVKEESFVLGSTPRSLAAAMESCINDLDSVDARKMLFLMNECKGEAVPEAVLRILHASVQKSSCAFFKLRDELVMRELLRPPVKSEKQGQNGGEATAWSLGSLAKIFIEHLVDEKEITSVISELFGEPLGDELSAGKPTVQMKHGCGGGSGESEKAKVTMVLCALYFDENHSDRYEAVIKAMARANISYAHDSFTVLRRQAIEPMVWLLDKQEEDEDENNIPWTEADVSCVTKVFLGYICDGQLDGENISHLLRLEACQTTKLAVLKAIRDISLTEEKPLFNKNNLVFLQAVAHLMESNKDASTTSIYEAASSMLHAVCWKCGRDESSSFILDEPTILDLLVDALGGSIHFSRIHAARALHGLSYSLSYKSDINRVKIAQKPGALVGLVNCLLEDEQALQVSAAWALTTLAISTSESVRIKIAKTEGVMAAMEKCLASHPALQERAARTLCCLAECGEANAILKERKGLKKGLLSLLEDGISPDTQYDGAWALTLIDPIQGKKASLTSARAYEGRAIALVFLEMYKEALVDIDQAIVQGRTSGETLRWRCCVRAKLGDFEGALEDINKAMNVQGDNEKGFNLQERGVLKRMMKDLEGSLTDLDEGLNLEPGDYERLKHRGYVKFLLKNEEGAHADAKWALRIKPQRVDRFLYGKYYCFGTTSVEFLGYQLK